MCSSDLATISESIANLAGLTTAGTDAITVTVTDAASVAEFNTLDAKTSVNVVLQGGISDTAANLSPAGVNSAGFTAATTQDTDVTVTITGANPTVAELNAISGATTGIVTATISESIANLAGLTTAGTDAITVTVTDAASVAQFNTLDAKTSVNVVLQGGVSDIAAAYAAADGTTTEGLTAIAAQDGDAVLTVTDAVTIAQVNTLDAATSSNLVLSGGISDTAANLSPAGVNSAGFTAATTQDTDVKIGRAHV